MKDKIIEIFKQIAHDAIVAEVNPNELDSAGFEEHYNRLMALMQPDELPEWNKNTPNSALPGAEHYVQPVDGEEVVYVEVNVHSEDDLPPEDWKGVGRIGNQSGMFGMGNRAFIQNHYNRNVPVMWLKPIPLKSLQPEITEEEIENIIYLHTWGDINNEVKCIDDAAKAIKEKLTPKTK